MLMSADVTPCRERVNANQAFPVHCVSGNACQEQQACDRDRYEVPLGNGCAVFAEKHGTDDSRHDGDADKTSQQLAVPSPRSASR